MKKTITFILILTLTAAFISGCGKTPEIAEEVSNVEPNNPTGITYEVTEANKKDITLHVCNPTGNPLFYEGHFLASLQMKVNGEWHDVMLKNFAMTMDIQIEEISAEDSYHTIHVEDYYGGALKQGTYRLITVCYPSIDDLMHVTEETRIVLGAEFTV